MTLEELSFDVLDLNEDELFSNKITHRARPPVAARPDPVGRATPHAG